MLPLALLTASLALAPQDPARDADAAFAALVPTDACILVRIASLDATDAAMAAIAGASGAPAGEDARTWLATALQAELPLELVDPQRPIAIGATLPAGAFEPTRTYVLPVSDADAFAAALDDTPTQWTAAIWEDYVALSDIDDYAPPVTASPLLAGLTSDCFALRVDMQGVMSAYAPMIELGMQEFRSSFESELAGEPAAELLREVPDFVEEFVDALQRIDVELVLDGTALRFEIDCTLDPDSALGKADDGEHVFAAELAGRMPPDAAVQFVADYDANWLEPLTELALAEIEKSLRADALADLEPATSEGEAMLDALRAVGDQLAQVGRRSAFAFDLGDEGFTATVCLSTSDPAAMAGAHSKLVATALRLTEEEPEIAIGPSSERGIGGVTFTETSISVELALVESGDSAEVASEKRTDELLVGTDGLRFAYGSDAGHFLLALDADDAALARLAGAGVAALDPTLDELAGASSGFWLRSDLARIAEINARIAAAEAGNEVGASTGASAAVAVWGGVRGSHWFCGISTERTTLDRAFELLESENGASTAGK
ncbi:MAG: hypothetical protein EPO68_08065 [Planctomycetota bacterium]|nr:MAG: hypothetical protein EPO68_08065 [Planctomycetota bacterium]